MKNILIMCAGGFSSSLMAKKTTELMRSKGYDVNVEASSESSGHKKIEAKEYDLYLISPQIRMYSKRLINAAEKANVDIDLIPFDAYSPVVPSMTKLAKIIIKNLNIEKSDLD